VLKLGAANSPFDGPVRGTGRGLRRRRSPTLNSTVNLSPLIENLRRHSQRLGIWNTEETLDVVLQRPLVSSVVDSTTGNSKSERRCEMVRARPPKATSARKRRGRRN
jgi:hypothetical protein